MSDQLDQDILNAVEKFNSLIKGSIDGPNCIDRNVCLGDCCFIQIDVPKALAQFYIDKGWAKEEDFARGDIFSFHINVDLRRLKCVFFDHDLNGCSLHLTGMKPPQCWVYPTGLDLDDIKSKCKKAEGWNVIKSEHIEAAKEVLDTYVSLCRQEFNKENSKSNIEKRIRETIIREIMDIPPRNISAIEDRWNEFKIIKDQGYNMGIKSFCNENQENCSCDFFECDSVCENVAKSIFKFLTKSLPSFILSRGAKESYSLSELKNQ